MAKKTDDDRRFEEEVRAMAEHEGARPPAGKHQLAEKPPRSGFVPLEGDPDEDDEDDEA